MLLGNSNSILPKTINNLNYANNNHKSVKMIYPYSDSVSYIIYTEMIGHIVHDL